MKAFKFMIGDSFVDVPSRPGLQVRGIVAVVLAETEAEAREIVKADNWDSDWLEVAQVRVIELNRPRLLAYAGSF
jgi:hypothetical protein